jgi:4-amino-4-deoxy-L-arabinose transferase-like glycosyltransferase
VIRGVLLAGILSLAAILRFYSLSGRGLIYWDEAKFSLEGVRLEAYLQALFGHHVFLTAGKSVGTAKPTHALFIALAYAVFGIHDYAPLYMDALASVVDVALAYFLGKRLFGPIPGLVGALFLAVSEYDVIYARSALSESDADALFLAGVLLWVIGWDTQRSDSKQPARTPAKWLILAGLFAGASFTANYRLSVYILVLVVFDFVRAWRTAGWSAVPRRILPWAVGLAAVPLLWQLVDVAARAGNHVLFRSEVNVIIKSHGHVIFKNVSIGKPEWYLTQALFQLHGGKQSVVQLNPLPYLEWFYVRQGIPICLLVLLGLYFALRTRTFPWLVTASFVVIPFLIYMFAPFIVPRNLDAALPFVSILAAATLFDLVEMFRVARARPAVMVGLTAAIALLGVTMSWRLTHETSGFKSAAAYVWSHGGTRVLASNEVPIFYFPGPPYGTRCDAIAIPGPLAKLEAERAAGYRYVILDHTGGSFLTRYVAGHAKLAASFPAFGSIDIGENPIRSENTIEPSAQGGAPQRILVFDMTGLKLPRAGSQRPTVCDRNVPI